MTKRNVSTAKKTKPVKTAKKVNTSPETVQTDAVQPEAEAVQTEAEVQQIGRAHV